MSSKRARIPRPSLGDLAFLAGVVLILVGVARIYGPAALILGGLVLIFAGRLRLQLERKEPS